MKFLHTTSSAVPHVAIEAMAGELSTYAATLRRVTEVGDYRYPESSLCVPADDYMLNAVESLVDKLDAAKLKVVFVIGIGGSNLGTKAIYEAMAGARDLTNHDLPRLIFLDTTDNSLLKAATTIIEQAQTPEELVFLVISKSGTTTETLFNAEVVLAAFANKFGRRANRVVILSEDGSPLLAAAREQQMHTIPLPPIVGGRYSVFTPVGLLPLALLGMPIRELRKGAEAQLMASLHPDIRLSAAGLSALTQYYFFGQGIRQHDTFVFSPRLESLGKWYRQLLAESIGKTTNDERKVAVGITPTISVGSTDLHSVGQLYLGGPRDRVTTFVSIATSTPPVKLTEGRVWPDLLPVLNEKSAASVTEAILAGTKAAYNQNRLPFLEVQLDAVNLFELGAFMQFKMCEVMFLGHLLHVNPFDQPHVEQYKVVTKQILSGENNIN